MAQDFDELISLVGPSEAKVLEEGVPDALLGELQSAEGTKAAKEIAEAGIQTEETSASAAVQTEGTSASAAVQATAQPQTPAAGVPATAQPQTPPRLVEVPALVKAAWKESLGHVDGKEFHYVMQLRARLWKAILGGAAYYNDPEAITTRQAIMTNMSSPRWDLFKNRQCP